MKNRRIALMMLSLLAAASVFAAPIDLTGLTSYRGVAIATGATITKEALLREDNILYADDCGAVALEKRSTGDSDTHAVENTAAINAAIKRLARQGGGTLVFTSGTYRVYTIELESGVNIRIDEGATIQAARTRTFNRQGEMTGEAEDFNADGTPGNYLQPEVNIYAGLQDGGHTYFANSLFYAADKENIMIYGDGLIDGSQMNDEGVIEQILSGGDPSNPANRTGQIDVWYGNKGIALLRCRGVVLEGFNMLNCGHFAIINEGTVNMLVDGLVVDTNRDAFNIDCGQDVTIINSHFNSLTDDAIVFKASYGAGIFQPTRNCVVKDCIVSGYDAGSVLAGAYTTDKQVATDLCGPTARIKFGTESTCGYDTVTIDNVRFMRSRGFCLEAVDGSPIHDIIMVNCTMDTVSSSPVFIRIGNRGRYPVTGMSSSDALNQSANVRLTNTGWIIPMNTASSDYTWTVYPIQRYVPVYNYVREGATMSNGIAVQTVDQENPVRINENALVRMFGRWYFPVWNGVNYGPDFSREIAEEDLGLYGDALGFDGLAEAYNIVIANLEVTNADPRYPITLAGLVDSKIRNVVFENVSVQYRGGLTMRDAVEQRQLTTSWNYTQYQTAPQSQTLPWLVNTFFAKNSALLPRVVWDDEWGWVEDPYNVPEMPEQYPEPSNFGILPSYGLYARHAEDITLENVSFSLVTADGRHAVVLDDCQRVSFSDFSVDPKGGLEPVALVDNEYKRATSFEYVPDYPYQKTVCEDITGIAEEDIYRHTVTAPEPGTPSDSLYSKPTIADVDSGFYYEEALWVVNGNAFTYPVTVHRPFFEPIEDVTVKAGETVSFEVIVRNPAAEVNGERDQAASDATLDYYIYNMPEGSTFSRETHLFTWPDAKAGVWEVTFVADDRAIPVSETVRITVE